LFLRRGLVVRVRFWFLWCVVGVVRAVFGLINLHQLYSYTSDDLLGDVSELMATCDDRSFRSGEISFSMCQWRSFLSATTLTAERGGSSKAKM
jgi:hypothetical protein